METTPVNASGISYRRVEPYAREPGQRRWIGRCKTCKTVARVEGVMGHGWMTGAESIAIANDGRVYRTADHGCKPTVIFVTCGAQCGRVKLERVHDSHKPNHERTECNAKCTGATGPACDCRCRGANHGAGH